MRIKIVLKNKEKIDSLIEEQKGRLQLSIDYYDVEALSLLGEAWLDEHDLPKKYRHGFRIEACKARRRSTVRWKFNPPDSIWFCLERGKKDWFLVNCWRDRVMMYGFSGEQDGQIEYNVIGRTWLVRKKEVPEHIVNYLSDRFLSRLIHPNIEFASFWERYFPSPSWETAQKEKEEKKVEAA
jgi:hypothetical protein